MSATLTTPAADRLLWRAELAAMSLQNGLTLTPFQADAAEAVLRGVFHCNTHTGDTCRFDGTAPLTRHVLLTAPTGAGKTYIAGGFAPTSARK